VNKVNLIEKGAKSGDKLRTENGTILIGEAKKITRHNVLNPVDIEKLNLSKYQNLQQGYINLLETEYQKNLELFQIYNPLEIITNKLNELENNIENVSLLDKEFAKLSIIKTIFNEFVENSTKKARELKLKSFNKLVVRERGGVLIATVSPLRPSNKRPNVAPESLKSKKIIIAFSESKYEQLKSYQDKFQYGTFTSLLEDLIEKGLEQKIAEFEKIK